ncbi:Ger(x)C family spore germination protein [Sporomusa sphaeroides]|uniref:Spore germination protein A3 n=1 Tax=Sporomusa sphaeroides DSM 2875 TaxID=1337886 RepID=A0ABM9W0T7_9FIRM|nr:Ger(x)C family spore germination protein [Sporomusa sphaeroides]OLS56845.1 spore germination protein A3 precursor [Sporomusa sphaeroides DSM 2875]CVK18792.1 Spore germination protein A3 precursor [Sporomusa sphaeroides DSM 2875]
MELLRIKNNKAKSLVIWLLLAAICLPLAGCWDQRELQNRQMVLAAAVDIAEGDEKEQEQFAQPHGGKKFRLSVQLLDIEPQQGEQQGGAKISTFVISGTGHLFSEIERDMLGQLGKPMNWEHIQAIVISQAAIEAGGIGQIMDWFVRDIEMRWRIRVYVTTGEAKPIIEYQPPNGEPNGLFLSGIGRNYLKDPHIAGADTELGFLIIRMDNKVAAPFPTIQLTGDVLKVGGTALIMNGELAGYVDEYDSLGAKLITGLEKSAIITTACTKHPDRIYAFELFRHDTRLTPHVSGDNIYYTLDIAMYGNIGEMEGCPEPHEHEVRDPQYIRKLELQFAEEVKKAVYHSYKRHQALRADALRMGKKMQIRYPKKWAEIKDRWHKEIFPFIPLVVSVNVTIHQLGEHK